MNNKFEFNYKSLKKFLMHMLEIAPIIPMEDAPKSKGNFIILRHDVDLDIYPVYKLGQIEKELGIKSTFFIMTTCQNYNPLAPNNRKLINKIKNDGHEIGLHFDPTIYSDCSEKNLAKKPKMKLIYCNQ